MAREKVLIIEGAESTQGQSEAILACHQYEAEAVEGAREALERMESEPFDLVLADLSLPEMGGLQLLQRLNEVQQDVPTVVMAGPGSLQKAVLSLKLGAQGFVVRPFTARELLMAVESALKKSRLSRKREDIRVVEALELAHFDAMKALAQAIEAKDHYTRGHCDRMVEYSVAVGLKLGLSGTERKILRYAAALHDIGKIGIPEAILTKDGRLTEEEYAIMKDHARKGAEIIRGVRFLDPVVPIIYHHQERYDGKGYPDGLSGEQIPLGSRIIAVLDTFDAMTTDRPYRKALPIERAMEELKRFSNLQFDPLVVEAFFQVLEEPGILEDQITHPDVSLYNLSSSF